MDPNTFRKLLPIIPVRPLLPPFLSSLPAAVLDPPKLIVTHCDLGALCVDLLPPVEHLRKVYQELDYQLKIQAADTLMNMVGLQDSPALLPLPLPSTCL